METDREATLTQLLLDAEAAHGVYEATELNGVYDTEWPRWYAGHMADNGLATVVGRDVPSDELAELLASAYLEFEQLERKPTEPWSTFLARRLASAL